MSSLWPVSGSAEEILGLLRAWDAAADPEPLMIETSGSTGARKRVLLSRAAMRASALATQERLGGPGQWVLNLPPTYVAGVQVLFRCVLAGTEPVLMAPEDDYESVWRRMTAERTYLSLVPTQLYRQLEDGFDTHDLTRFTTVLIGGGPLAVETRREAEEAGVRIVQTYGMSETCGGCVYDGWPLAGVEVRVDDGQVLLRGPMLFDGYRGEPGRTAAALQDGWFHTDDLGHLDPDGRLWVDGRTDDVIISGGVKVPAPAVAAALLRHPEVVRAHVLGVPDPEWGERVVAVLVGTDPQLDGPEPRARAATNHSPTGLGEWVEQREWRPKQVVWVEELPMLANGKPDRQAIRALVTAALVGEK